MKAVQNDLLTLRLIIKTGLDLHAPGCVLAAVIHTFMGRSAAFSGDPPCRGSCQRRRPEAKGEEISSMWQTDRHPPLTVGPGHGNAASGNMLSVRGCLSSSESGVLGHPAAHRFWEGVRSGSPSGRVSSTPLKVEFLFRD